MKKEEFIEKYEFRIKFNNEAIEYLNDVDENGIELEIQAREVTH